MTDQDGKPVEGASAVFDAKNTKFADCLNTINSSSPFGFSDEESIAASTITIKGLPSQQYEIKVKSDGYKEKTVTVDIGAQDAIADVVLEKE